jgi:hypothetical protein
MRTVHETEALRPSDPVPKSMQPAKSSARLKLILKPSNSSSTSPSRPSNTDAAELPISEDGIVFTPLPSSLFTPEEISMGPKELFRLLRRQVHWAEEEAESLRQQIDMMEKLRRQEWLEKELLLDQVIKNEHDWQERRRAVLAGLNALPAPAADPVVQEPTIATQEEAAAVLASLHQA